MEIKKKTLYMAAAVLAILVFGAIGILFTPAAQITGAVVAKQEGVQNVILKMENYGYVMEPSELQAGVPVRMEVDMDTVFGCMRDVVISQFDVRKYVSEKDNVIEFTPDKTGTFDVVCSMNMGRGQFTVTEADNA